MDHDDDVERLFSWIKTPDLHYREFAGERELADAEASWPTLRRDARHTDGYPEAEARPPSEPPAPVHSPLGERLGPLREYREAPPEPPVAQPPEMRVPPPEEPAGEVPWAPEPPRPSPSFARLEPTQQPARPTPPRPEPAPQQPNEQYQGFEEGHDEPIAAERDRQGETRSLDAIFSRVSHQPRASRDERQRSPGAPGLGPVFRRLR